MFRKTPVIECLFGLSGFRQTSNPDYPQLSDSLVQTESGLYYQDEQPLITIENIDQSLKNYDKYIYPDYVATTGYLKGNQVDFNGTAYEALTGTVALPNTGNQPDTSLADWVEMNPLTEKLTGLVKSSINKVLTTVMNNKKIRRNTKGLLDDIYLFDGVGRMSDKEVKKGRFVGLSFKVKKQRDLVTVIKKIGLQFDSSNTDFCLYLFHSSQQDPIKKFTYNVAGQSSMNWQTQEDFILPYNGIDYDAGGVFIIGYYEEDLTGQAINKNYDWGSSPSCMSCNRNYSYYQQWSNYFDFTPISINSDELIGIKPSDGGAKMFNIDRLAYHYDANFGINLEVSAKCDLTDFICSNREVFTDAILLQVAHDILMEIAYSTRNNVISKETRTLAMYELDNRENNTPGLIKRLNKEVEGIDFEMSNLNSVCQTCLDKWGPRHTQV